MDMLEKKTLNFLMILHKILSSTNITKNTKYAFSSATNWLINVINSQYLVLVTAQEALRFSEI